MNETPGNDLIEASGCILIVTVTKVEATAVRQVFCKDSGKDWVRRHKDDKTYYELGLHGGAALWMVQSEMGIAGPGGALLTVRRALDDLRPQAVIMCGTAFGTRPDKQKLGDVLISRQLEYYESQKVDLQKGLIPRGDRVTASERLLDRFRSADNDWKGAPTHFGLVLSGEKLVNDPAFLKNLLKLEPEAVGGEMEGAGLYAAARDAKVDWILVKAICDWADGKKNSTAQAPAALNAAKFVLHVIRLGGWTKSGAAKKPAAAGAKAAAGKKAAPEGPAAGAAGPAKKKAPVPPVKDPNELKLALAPGVELFFRRVAPGEFFYSNSQWKVGLAEFWIGKYPVTNAQFRAFVQAAGYVFAGRFAQGKDKHPVVNVTWNDAAAFCAWASARTGKLIELPSEAQWEKAARGTDGRAYPWGDANPGAALLNFNDLVRDTTPVDQYPKGASSYGALDMAGNVWEWTADWWSETYLNKNPGPNPKGPPGGFARVIRGGSFNRGAEFAGCTSRYRSSPVNYEADSGFRVVLIDPGQG